MSDANPSNPADLAGEVLYRTADDVSRLEDRRCYYCGRTESHTNPLLIAGGCAGCRAEVRPREHPSVTAARAIESADNVPARAAAVLEHLGREALRPRREKS